MQSSHSFQFLRGIISFWENYNQKHGDCVSNEDTDNEVDLFIDKLNAQFGDILTIFEEGKIAADCFELRRELIANKIHPDQLWHMINQLGTKHYFFAPANDRNDNPNDPLTIYAQVVAGRPDLIRKCERLKVIAVQSEVVLQAIMRDYIQISEAELPGNIKKGRHELKNILLDAGLGDAQSAVVIRRFENAIHDIAGGIWDVPKR